MTQMAQKGDRAISNLEYDLLTALQNKAEAVKAYETYIQDAQQMDSQPCVQLFQKLREQDQQTAQEIRHHLQQVMQNGKM
jgi:ferritin-like metal-binding protein YciE